MEIVGVSRWVSFPVPATLPLPTGEGSTELESERETYLRELDTYRWLSASVGYRPVIHSVEVSNLQHLRLVVPKRGPLLTALARTMTHGILARKTKGFMQKWLN